MSSFALSMMERSSTSDSSLSHNLFVTKTQRPKSTPANSFHRRITEAHCRAARPQTAAIAGYECERLGQVERESIRQHKFRQQFGKRHAKPPPWQAKLELERLHIEQIDKQTTDAHGTPKPVHTAPGYMLSRSKAKYQVVLQDRLFEEQENERSRQNQKKSTGPDPEILLLVETLKEQVADLNVFLEEERLQHKDTKRRAEEYLQDKLEEARTQQKEVVRRLVDEHEEQCSQIHSDHQQDIANIKQTSEDQIARYRTELEFLQGAFQSYKSQTVAENTNRLHDQEKTMKSSYEQQLQTQLHDQAAKLKREYQVSMAHSEREHNKVVNMMEKECTKKVESLNRRYANHAADVKKIKTMEEKLKELELQLDSTRVRCNACEKELVNIIRERDELRVKSSVFERDFKEKVNEVDASYKSQLADLMEQNTQLRKQYVKKCEELYSVTAELDSKKQDKLQSAKDAMKCDQYERRLQQFKNFYNLPNIVSSVGVDGRCSQFLLSHSHNLSLDMEWWLTQIHHQTMPRFVSPTHHHFQCHLKKSRNRANVSISASDPAVTKKHAKDRPCSAPSTQKEVLVASQSAGETDSFLARKEEPFIRPQSVLELSAVFDIADLNLLSNEELSQGLNNCE